MLMFSCRSRCVGWLQRDHICLRTDVLREDTHHGGETPLSVQHTSDFVSTYTSDFASIDQSINVKVKATVQRQAMTFIFNQRIRAQQPLCNSLTTNTKSSQAGTLAELLRIRSMIAESILSQEVQFLKS